MREQTIRSSAPELLWALAAIVIVTAGYISATARLGSPPAAGVLGGHLLGVVGFVLMLMTETLYSLRKRLKRAARWGSMQSWLRFHIFTGVLGPYLVLLHTSWHFAGLAGLVMLLTVIMAASGFVGRYIYTAVPRAASGVELQDSDLESEISANEGELKAWLERNPWATSDLPAGLLTLPPIPYTLWPLIFGRLFAEWDYRFKWWLARRRTRRESRRKLDELGALFRRRRQLHYQIASLALARRVLALWHSVHVPVGIALFSLAFVHIGAAMYFVTFAK